MSDPLPDAAPGRTRRPALPLACVLLGALAVAGYLNTLDNGFVLDDRHVILRDPTLRDLRSIPSYFVTPYWATTVTAKVTDIGGASYRPLATTSFALDYALWGADPRGYHATNVLLHAAATLALLLLLRRLCAAGPLPWVAAALFAVHPVHTEAVAAIAFRPEVMATVFALLALHAYAGALPARLLDPAGPAGPAPQANRPMGAARALALALPCLLAALLCKESAIVVPVLCAGLEAVAFGRSRAAVGGAAPHRGSVLRLGAVAATTALYLALRLHALQQLGSGVDHFARAGADAGTRAATMIAVLGDYLRLLVCPHPLCADYLENSDVTPALHHFTDPAVACAAAALAAVVIVSLALRRRAPHVGFFGAWFFVTLFPVSQLVFPLFIVKSERVLYLPSVAGCVWVGTGLLALRRAGSASVAGRWAGNALIAAVIGAGGVATWERNRDWHDPITFARRLIVQEPANPRAHLWLATAFITSGRPEEALHEYDRILELVPGNYLPLMLRGIAREALGDPYRALGDLNAALRAFPGAPVFAHRARCLQALGRDDESWRELEQARAVRPGDPEVARAFAPACLRRGKLGEARQALVEALTTFEGRPPDPSRLELEFGRAALEAGLPAEAADALAPLEATRPDNAEVPAALGEALRRLGRLDAARTAFDRALARDPAQGTARAGRGRCLLASGGDSAVALADLRAALPDTPDPVEVRQDIVLALLRLGRPAEANAEMDRLKAAGVPVRADVLAELRKER